MMRIGDTWVTADEYAAWMQAATSPGGMAGGPASTLPVDPTKMTAEEWAASRPEWNVTPSGPHPSSNDPRDKNGDGAPDDLPPGLTGLPPSGPASTLPGNPGIDQTDANKNGTPDIYEQGPGSPGYTGSEPAAPMIDRDNNGIDDREQTTVGATGPVGPNYADWWAQTLASNPQMGYGGNGQMGWGGAMTTGTGAPIDMGGGGGGYGGGTAGGGNFSLPSAGGGFSIPPAPTANFPDLTQIGTGVSAGPGTGTGTGGFTIPEFQNPLAGYGTTGTGTTGTTTSTGTAPLAGYGGTGASPNAGLVSDLANSYQNQTDAANQANMSRYDQGLAALLDRMNRAGLAINNLTNEGIADIGRQFEGARATADQDLINRGLANTTVRSGVMRGLTTDQAAETNRYWDNQARQNLNEDYRQTGDIVNWIGGRNDVAPSTGDLANLASGVGAAGPTTLTGSTSTTPAATQPAVNLPPQITTALQNGTLMNLAPTQSGAAPATTGNTFLNQGAGITTPQQQAAAANAGGAVTRNQMAAPPPAAVDNETLFNVSGGNVSRVSAGPVNPVNPPPFQRPPAEDASPLSGYGMDIPVSGPTSSVPRMATNPAATPPMTSRPVDNETRFNVPSGNVPRMSTNPVSYGGPPPAAREPEATDNGDINVAPSGNVSRVSTNPVAPPPMQRPPAESASLSGYGSASQLTEQEAAAAMEGDMQRAMRAGMSGAQTRTQREMQARSADTSGSSSIGGVRADGAMSPYQMPTDPNTIGPEDKAKRAQEYLADPNRRTFENGGLSQFGQYTTDTKDWTAPTSTGTLPTQQPFMGGGNANNGKSGADANYAPSNYDPQSSGTRNGNTWMTDAAVSPVSKAKTPAPPPSSPSVMGFPDPQGTGVAPGNPNDVTQSMRQRDPNNSQYATNWASQNAGVAAAMAGAASSPMPGMVDAGYRGGDAGFNSMAGYGAPPPSSPTSPSMPPLGKVPQRPEPVPFASAPPMSPMSGYGSSTPPGPSMMAPPGPAAAPTFQQYGAPGVQNKTPSLVGGVMMPQPPARRWGV
jgi:hypothetical protein